VHRFTRAVSVSNPREFLQAEKEEQEIAEACKRLIKNCIICWNYLYLSQKLEDTEDTASREAFLEAVAGASAVSWQHINLLGEYDFSDEKLQDTVGIKPPKLANQRDTFLGVAKMQKRQNSKGGRTLDKFLFRIWYLCCNLTRLNENGPTLFKNSLKTSTPAHSVRITSLLKWNSCRSSFCNSWVRPGASWPRRNSLISRGFALRSSAKTLTL
jgi:hypothetical protein